MPVAISGRAHSACGKDSHVFTESLRFPYLSLTPFPYLYFESPSHQQNFSGGLTRSLTAR